MDSLSMLVIISLGLPCVFLLHIFNNILIVLKKRLHKPQYYILVNLSISDICLLIVVAAYASRGRDGNIVLIAANNLFATGSVLSTFAISIDRYIAVQHCLRYRVLMTAKSVAAILSGVWMTSCILVAIPFYITDDSNKRQLYSDCILVPVFIISCFVSLFISLWIHIIRMKHVKEIENRKIYFGIQHEKLSTLNNMKSSIFDIIKLNVMTTILIVTAEISRLVAIYHYDNESTSMNMTKAGVSFLYVLSNPLVYIVSMTDLKREYAKLLSCQKQNSIADIHVETNSRISEA